MEQALENAARAHRTTYTPAIQPTIFFFFFHFPGNFRGSSPIIRQGPRTKGQGQSMSNDRESLAKGAPERARGDGNAVDASNPAEGARTLRLAQLVAKANAYHSRHPDIVKRFNDLTGAACAGPNGISFRALRKWQAEHGANVDGLVGPETLAIAEHLAGGDAAKTMKAAEPEQAGSSEQLATSAHDAHGGASAHPAAAAKDPVPTKAETGQTFSAHADYKAVTTRQTPPVPWRPNSALCASEVTHMSERECDTQWRPSRERRWSEQEGRAMVAALRASGASIGEFAARHELDPQRVRYWLGRVEEGRAARRRMGNRAIGFAPVRVIEAPTREAALARVIEVAVGPAVVRVGEDFDEGHLRRVVAALRGAPC